MGARWRYRVGGWGILAAVLLLGLPWLAVGQEREPERIGADLCLLCHAENAPGWYTLRHNRFRATSNAPEMLQGCEGCHGPGQAHLEDENFRSILNPDNETGWTAVAMCFECHSTTMKSSAWLQSTHALADVNCGDCHEMHSDLGHPNLLREEPNDLCLSCHRNQTAQFRLPSHHPVLEGNMRCVDCHDPHADGMLHSPMLKQSDDRCLSCHQEKKGPFVYEHQNALGGGDDGCLTCHKAHGSANSKLTAFYGRGTCLQCHADISADPAHQARPGNCWQAGCHNRIHGSNNSRLFIN